MGFIYKKDYTYDRLREYGGGMGVQDSKKQKPKKKAWMLFVASLVSLLLLCVVLWYQGILMPNSSTAKQYSVKGIDVSAYQGEINWKTLAKQPIEFAFIKATEGSTYKDKYFTKNWEGAKDTNLRIGTYHFFSFDSKGETQAQNYIQTVPRDKNALPPVIDIEFYGDKEKNPPAPKQVEKELTAMIKILEDHYDKRIIIYTKPKAYKLYIQNKFKESDIWIRSVLSKPSLEDQKSWTFWQYSDRGRMEGYQGKEKFIDLNVFRGTKQEFDNYGY